MQSVNDLAGAALRGLLADQPATPGKVALAWRLAAGPTLARAASIEWHESGVLHIRVADPAWLKEIRFARPKLVERLREMLGSDAVRRVEISD